jgi:hypothetical protein
VREITVHDKYRHVRLELQRHTEQYPQLVKAGTLTTEEAEYLLAVQQSMLNDYERLLEGEPFQQ